MNKLNVLLGIGILFLLVSGISASYWIYSNSITVSVGAYSFNGSLQVDNASPTLNHIINFNGTLYYNGNPVGLGYEIFLLKNGIPVTSSFTDASGYFSIAYNVTEEGIFDFKAGYEVP